MNRNGQLTAGIILAIALAVVGIILGLSVGFKVLFSQKYLFYAIGIFIIVMTFVYMAKPAFSGNLTKGKRNGIIIGFVIGVAFIGVAASGVLQTAISGFDYIQVPTVGYYECAPSTNPIVSEAISLPAGISSLSCPANTDKCDFIFISSEASSLLPTRQFYYSVIGSDGKVISQANSPLSSTSNTIRLSNVAKGQHVNVAYMKWAITGTQPITGASAKAQYNPFILWDNPGLGGRHEYTTVQQGCTFPSSDRNDLIIKDTLGIGTGRTGTASAAVITLEPYKTRNYLDVIVPVNVESRRIQTYNGQTAYCSNKQIYKIDEVSTLGETYKVVNYNAPLGTVSCCNGDIEGTRQCENNQWKSLPTPGQPVTNATTVQCSAFQPCSGYEFAPYDGKTLIRYACQSGRCVPETKSVECTTNSQCGGDRPVCDTKTYACVSAPLPNITIPGLPVSSAQAACDAKASASPLLGYTFVQSNTQDCGFLCSFGLKKPVTTTTTECKPAFVPYYIFAAVILILGIALVILLKSPQRRRK